MKRIFLFIAMVMMSVLTMAQAPKKMNFQALVRNSSNELVTNQMISMEISVLNGSNTAVYTETQSVTTNANGVATLVIGEGKATKGTFAGIDWSAGNYYLQTTANLGGGASAIVGTTPLLSVPYALYAEKAGNAAVDLSNYATKDEIPAEVDLSGYYSKAEIDELLANLESKIGEGSGSGEQGNSGNGVSNGMEYVDLGLSVKWATCNIGASKPEGYGDYYAWGETSTKSTYNWSTYKYCNGSYDTQTKYCTSSSYGKVDNKTTLEKSDDVAYTTLGGSWRMPTDAEWTELRNQCEWTWKSKNGVDGYEVKASNGNSIFLPAAGFRDASSLYGAGSYGFYWSSSLSGNYPYDAWYVGFNSDYVSRYDNSRGYGQSVRPVLSLE
ncbi:MAG: hypothetical protein MJ204_02120 [Bacteroidales bacterium]|nr:hypothetical protein [Bacteroidales bacterium]